MATGVNRVHLIGNLGADPELRHTQSGQAVCEFRLATNESWTDKHGEKHEFTVTLKLAASIQALISSNEQRCVVLGRPDTAKRGHLREAYGSIEIAVRLACRKADEVLRARKRTFDA